MSETSSYTINLDQATNDKLVALAQQRQEIPERTIAEAVDAFITFDIAFIEAVNDGLAYLKRPDMTELPHDQVMTNIRQHLRSRAV